MNAIIITSSNFPFGGAGANYLRLFSRGLVEKGWDVKVLLVKGYIYGKERISENKINIYEKVQYIHCGLINRPFTKVGKFIDNILGIFYSGFYLARNLDKETIVLIYNNEIHLHFLCFLIAKLSKLKIISFVPEGLEKANRKSSLISYLSWFSFYLNMSYFNVKSSKLIVFSSYLRNYYISKGYNTNDILLIPNLLDLDYFTQNNVVKLQRSKFRVGYCGNPCHKDGIEDLFESFRIISRIDSSFELLIVGDSVNQNSVLEKLKAKLKNDNLLDKVIFTGLIPYKEIPAMLHSCDVLVLARPTGIQADAGFPTKLGEYFACKKPVVITKVGDIPNYFEDEVNILLAEPDNPNSIADKIIWVKNNPDKAFIIAQNGYKWAIENLDYKTENAKFIDFLNK
jgi:glycosyltransferase involved in cell wall biosynthesis